MLFSGSYILWPDPLVVSVMDPVQLDAVLHMRRPTHVLFSPTWIWTLRNVPHLALLRRKARRLDKTLHLMRCSAETDRVFRRVGFRGDLVSISSYVNEHLFRPTGEAKVFDAVYAASMFPYKRMHLAAKIPRLLIQTYGDRKTPTGEYDLPGFEPAVAHATYNRGWVPAEEVVAGYNRAHVGLALSKCEGAMLAAVEYMLCGTPLVSTPCKGGRELFFDDRFVKVVAPDPVAIHRAVDEMIARAPSPDLVRGETLAKLRDHRQRLCRYVRGIIAELGGAVPSEEQVYERVYGTSSGTSECFVHKRQYQDAGLI